jgi:hypothetical protein
VAIDSRWALYRVKRDNSGTITAQSIRDASFRNEPWAKWMASDAHSTYFVTADRRLQKYNRVGRGETFALQRVYNLDISGIATGVIRGIGFDGRFLIVHTSGKLFHKYTTEGVYVDTVTGNFNQGYATCHTGGPFSYHCRRGADSIFKFHTSNYEIQASYAVLNQPVGITYCGNVRSPDGLRRNTITAPYFAVYFDETQSNKHIVAFYLEGKDDAFHEQFRVGVEPPLGNPDIDIYNIAVDIDYLGATEFMITYLEGDIIE